MKNVTDTIERQARRTMARYDMLRPGERVLVAVSGGPDSTALLSVLCRLAPEMKLDLHVAPLDHGWGRRAPARGARAGRGGGFRAGGGRPGPPAGAGRPRGPRARAAGGGAAVVARGAGPR